MFGSHSVCVWFRKLLIRDLTSIAEMELPDCRGIMYSPCMFCSRSRKIYVFRLSCSLHSQSRRVVDLAIDVAIGVLSLRSQWL